MPSESSGPGSMQLEGYLHTRPVGSLQMSNRATPDSRRRLFTPHASSPSRLRLCPICQWAVEQDHAEALAIHTSRTPSLSHPAAGLAPERDAQEAAAVMGFALV